MSCEKREIEQFYNTLTILYDNLLTYARQGYYIPRANVNSAYRLQKNPSMNDHKSINKSIVRALHERTDSL